MAARSILAVLSDIHGNRWALEAVLARAQARGATRLLNLGDILYGPLDPSGTAELLNQCPIPSVTISGNEDRAVWDETTPIDEHPSLPFVRQVLAPERRAWLQGLPAVAQTDGVFLCHGTPESDVAPLLEEVTPSGVRLRGDEELSRDLAGARGARVVVCGHTHVPRVVTTRDGVLVVNPGSVGLPAYADTRPHPHRMEAGSPHARFAVLVRDESGWSVESHAVAYDWSAAAEAALRNGRADWASALRTGRA
jgi:predicted phosphodiesterase